MRRSAARCFCISSIPNTGVELAGMDLSVAKVLDATVSSTLVEPPVQIVVVGAEVQQSVPGV
jgi:hypothetical protein